MKTKVLYLICANDHLETAFFCGTSWECAKILGFKNVNTFHSVLAHRQSLMGGFVKIERVKANEVD